MLNIIKAFDSIYLERNNCYLSGDAAIHLLATNYREPTELHFLCATQEGYATIVNDLYENGIGSLFKSDQTPKQLRDVKGDMHGRYILAEFNGRPIKITITMAMFVVTKELDTFPLPLLSKESLFTQKLMAIDDHIREPDLLEQDIIDIHEMQKYWGDIPEAVFSVVGDRVSSINFVRARI